MKTETLNPFFRMLIVIGVFVIIGAPLIIYSEFGTDAIQVSSVMVSGLLSLSLVVLYYQQYGILKKQTKLQRREYQSQLTKRGTIVADDDYLTFNIKNKGRGKVTSMFLKSEVISDTGELEVDFGRTLLKNKDTGSSELPPDSEVKEFEAKANFRVLNWDNPDRGYSFKHISSRIARQNIDSCVIKLTLEVIDESLIEGQFSQEVEVATQELQLEGEVEKQITNENGDLETKVYYPSTTIEDSLDAEYSSNNDINKKSLDQITEGTEMIKSI